MPDQPTPSADALQRVIADILAFRDARDWKQFHTPRNLAAALAIEAGELQEVLLWKTDADVERALDDHTTQGRLAHELADVLIYALLLCESTGIDPLIAIREKLSHNAAKYPVEKAKGSAKKYSEFSDLPAPTDPS